jgi:hypothetical protein
VLCLDGREVAFGNPFLYSIKILKPTEVSGTLIVLKKGAKQHVLAAKRPFVWIKAQKNIYCCSALTVSATNTTHSIQVFPLQTKFD